MKYILHKNHINLNNIELSKNHKNHNKIKIIYHLNNNIKLNGLTFKLSFYKYFKSNNYYYFYINNLDLSFIINFDDFFDRKLKNYKRIIINNILKIKIKVINKKKYNLDKNNFIYITFDSIFKYNNSFINIYS